MFVVKKRLAHVLAFLVYSGIALGGEPNVGDRYASGALRGVTRGPDGQPLPRAQITVHSVAESSDLTVVSGSDGAFLVASLNPGQYQVSAKTEGFATLAAAAALRASAPARVTEIFARTRLAASRGATYGTSDIATADAVAILERALPG